MNEIVFNLLKICQSNANKLFDKFMMYTKTKHIIWNEEITYSYIQQQVYLLQFSPIKYYIYQTATKIIIL